LNVLFREAINEVWSPADRVDGAKTPNI